MSGNRTLKGNNANIALRMMIKVAEVLDKCNIQFSLDAGTLLGVIRENRLLPWDNDVDFTVTEQYKDRLIKNLWRIRLKGLYVTAKRYKNDLGFFKKGEVRIVKVKHINVKKFFKKDVVLEIFVKKKVGDEYYWTEGDTNAVLKSVPVRFHDILSEYPFGGFNFPVPKDHVDYLVCRYGENWRVPIKEWDFRTSDLNVRKVFD